MPAPTSKGVRAVASGQGWFAPVPAYRLATLRVALAVTSLVFHVPKFNGLIDSYLASSFHVSPALPWIPPPTPLSGAALMALQQVAAWGLLFGVAPRVSAWFLAVAGFWVMSLDPEHYAHNAQFHLTLLALIGCSSDGLTLSRLLRADDASARCPAWPEHLIRIQLCIVFFYAALDKVFSPFWRVSGGLIGAVAVTEHAPGVAWLQRLNQAVIRASPGTMSVVTTILEGFLAVAFVHRSLWRAAVAAAFLFAAYLEFLLRPGVFAWDTVAALVMFAPAGDRGWTVLHDQGCASCRRTRTILAPLDWLRRLRWMPIPAGHTLGVPHRGLRLISPRGRCYAGLEAIGVVPLVLPGPVFVAMATTRFAGGFLAGRGYGPWYDLTFVVLGLWLLLWVPRVVRFVGRSRVTTARP